LSKSKNAADRDDPVSITRQVSQRVSAAAAAAAAAAATDRPGLRVLLDYARPGDVIVVHTLDRLGRTVRDTLNLIHELAERGVGVRNLADPIRVDSSDPADPMAQLAVVLLACLGRWNAPTPSSGPPTPAPSPLPRAAGSAGRSQSTVSAGLRRSLARRRANHRRDRHHRDPADQPLPAPAAPAS